MDASMTDRFDGIPLRNQKAELCSGESPRQNLTPDGALVEWAMNHAGLVPKQLADVMGVSTSFLQRGFKDQEHISWQRLRHAGRTYPRFKRALLEADAADADGVQVVTEIRIPRAACSR